MSILLPRGHRRAQRGTTLLEALVSFLVLCLGMLTVARVQTQLHLGAALADQRSQAVRLAQQDLETLRDFSVLGRAPARRAYDDIVSGAHAAHADTGSAAPTPFLVTRRIEPAGTAPAKNASVTVSWSDRAGQPQQVTLHAIIAAVDPASTGALALAQGPAARHAGWRPAPGAPAAAVDLGDGASLYRSVGDATLAYVIDNASGRVSARCTGASATAAVTRTELTHCEDRAGYLVTGVVRFSSASPPDAALANDAPLATTVILVNATGRDASAPSCTTQAMSASGPDGAAARAVPFGDGSAAATPVGPGPLRFVAYDCLVSPGGSGEWTGTTVLQPSGWRIGSRAGERRVCRYVGDAREADAARGSPGASEAPDPITLRGSLAHQNFLVIPATEACPHGNPARLADAGPAARLDPATVAHQP